MSSTERIYALLVAANPVPDPEVSPESVARTRPHLYVVEPRRTVMQTQHQPQQTKATKVPPPRRPRHAWLYAAAAFILVAVIGATAWMLQPDNDEAPIAPADTTTPAIVTVATTMVEIPDDLFAAGLPAGMPTVFPMPVPASHEALTMRGGSNISGAREHREIVVGFEIPEEDLESVVAMYEGWYVSQELDPDTQRFSSEYGTTISMKHNWPPGTYGSGSAAAAITSLPDKATTVELKVFWFLISDDEYQEWRTWAIEEGILKG